MGDGGIAHQVRFCSGNVRGTVLCCIGVGMGIRQGLSKRQREREQVIEQEQEQENGAHNALQFCT